MKKSWQWAVILGVGALAVFWQSQQGQSSPQQPPLGVSISDGPSRAALRSMCATTIEARTTEGRQKLNRGEVYAALALMEECKDFLPEGAAQLLYADAFFAVSQIKLAEAEKLKEFQLKQKKAKGVSLGMTPQEVMESSWGKPDKVNRSTTADGGSEQWVYRGGNYLYFERDKLVSIRN